MDSKRIADVLDHDGPFAAVCLDSTHDTEDAAKAAELRWRGLREQLIEAGTPEKTLLALDQTVTGAPPSVGRAGRYLLAAGNTVLVDEQLPAPPPAPLTRLSRLPYLVPLAEYGRDPVPHVIALIDKADAQLCAMDRDGLVRADFSVHGTQHPVHKARAGKLSHRSLQSHAEENVRHNVRDVAQQVAQLVQDVHARLLIIAGEVQARTELRAALPPPCARIAAELETGTLAPGGDPDAFAADVAALLNEQLRTERGATLDALRAELGKPDGLAVHGIRASAAALRQANAAALVLTDPDVGGSELWTGNALPEVAVDPDELGRPKHRDRADEVLPAAAISVGAQVLAGDQELGEPLTLADGVGVLQQHR